MLEDKFLGFMGSGKAGTADGRKQTRLSIPIFHSNLKQVDAGSSLAF